MREAVMGILLTGSMALAAGPAQRVEGWAETVFSPSAGGRAAAPYDYRGPAAGSMTAAWWAPGQAARNYVIWKTAPCPAKQDTEVAFIASSAVTPPEFSRGPQARLSVNGQTALTFDLGLTLDRTWRGNGFELRYEARRAEWPWAAAHRQFELNGQSGRYWLRVPAGVVTAGQPLTLKVEMLPFPAWPNGWFMVKHRQDALAETEDALGGQVQQLQRDVRRLQELAHVLAANQYSKLVDPRDYEHSIIHTDGWRHLHPADLIKLRNGEILVTAREAAEHIARDGDVIMLRSKDGGKTWGGRQVIAGIKDLDEREGCGIQLRDGTILMGIFFNDLYREDGDYEWNWQQAVKFTPEKRKLGTYIITSKDNGHTWSAPMHVDTRGMPFTDLEGPADAPVEMPDGSVLMPLMAYNVRGDMFNKAAVLLKTTDQGKSWQFVSFMAQDPGGKLGMFGEPGLVRTRSGRLIAALRNEGPENRIWTTHSDDGGKTWTPVKPSPMVGHPADLVQLADGRILCTYGTRSRRHADPAGIRAAFSPDNGESWQIDQEVQIRRDFLNMDIGYPESMQLEDGRVLTVYYFNLFGRFFLGQTIWRP
jgi:hypothetical protein